MIPTGAASHLLRKKEVLQRRRDKLVNELEEIDAALAEIQEGELALRAPKNGKAVRLPQILRGLELTHRDRVLAVVRSRPKSGVTRLLIAERLAQLNQTVATASISTYLTSLRRDGLVECVNGLWYPTP